MLSRCIDCEILILLSCQAFFICCLYFPWSRILEQKRAHYLLEKSYVSNFRNIKITISNVTQVLMILSVLFANTFFEFNTGDVKYALLLS